MSSSRPPAGFFDDPPPEAPPAKKRRTVGLVPYDDDDDGSGDGSGDGDGSGQSSASYGSYSSSQSSSSDPVARQQALEELENCKRAISSFRKRLAENLAKRTKHAEDPKLFMESELALAAALEDMLSLAAAPSCYPHLASSGALAELVQAVAHDNDDVSAAAVHVLAELVDEAVLEEVEDAEGFLGSLVAAGVFEHLVSNLSRFDREATEDAASAVFETLEVVEAVVAADPGLAEVACERSPLLEWLLARSARKGSDPRRLYATEVLATLLQGHEANCDRLAALKGVDTLLVSLSAYRKSDPATAEEEELMENLWDALCAALMTHDNRVIFLEGEGFELCVMMLAGRARAARGALRAADFALVGGEPFAKRFVDAGALKAVFPFLDPKRPADEERCLSILHLLLVHLPAASSRLDRLLAKFDDRDKVARIADAVDRYRAKVEECERAQASRNLAGLLDADQLLDGPDARFLERLEAGLFALQRASAILQTLAKRGKAPNLATETRESIERVLREFHQGLDPNTPEAKALQELL
jgi:beta-catenin-like protein 1